MLLQQALSLVAMGLFALVNAEPLTVTNNIAVVHGVKGEPIKISANYLTAFDNEDEPENDFVLVDEPVDIASKMISLRKRGTSCAEYYTGKIKQPTFTQRGALTDRTLPISQTGRHLPGHRQGLWPYHERIYGLELADQQPMQQLAHQQEVLCQGRLFFFLFILVFCFFVRPVSHRYA